MQRAWSAKTALSNSRVQQEGWGNPRSEMKVAGPSVRDPMDQTADKAVIAHIEVHEAQRWYACYLLVVDAGS